MNAFPYTVKNDVLNNQKKRGENARYGLHTRTGNTTLLYMLRNTPLIQADSLDSLLSNRSLDDSTPEHSVQNVGPSLQLQCN